jgi:hypothetical protein
VTMRCAPARSSLSRPGSRSSPRPPVISATRPCRVGKLGALAQSSASRTQRTAGRRSDGWSSTLLCRYSRSAARRTRAARHSDARLPTRQHPTPNSQAILRVKSRRWEDIGGGEHGTPAKDTVFRLRSGPRDRGRLVPPLVLACRRLRQAPPRTAGRTPGGRQRAQEASAVVVGQDVEQAAIRGYRFQDFSW